MEKNTWKKDLILALKNLNGCAHLSEIYIEIKKIRKEKINPTFDRTVQRELETNSSDSKAFNGKNDTFFMVEGKGKGVWGLREYENKFYWVSQNKTFNIERRDGYLWAPNKNKNKKAFKKGTIEGLLGMGSFIMTASLFASPLLGIIIGLVVLIVVKKQLKKIEVSEIYDWFRDQIKKHGKTLAAMGGGAGIAMMMGAI